MRRLVVLAVLLASALIGRGGGVALAAFTARESNPQGLSAAVLPPPALVAQSRSNDGGVTSSQVQLGLRLVNRGDGPASLATVTMRYWFTGDGARDLVTSCYFASFGCGNLVLGVTRLSEPRDRASHYFQVSFSGGSLAAGQSASLDQLAFRDQVGTPMRQDNDFSFANRSSFADSAAVTVYVGGELVWGAEPGVVPVDESFELQYSNRGSDPTDNAITPGLKLLSTGNTDVDLRRITIRYWFTKDATSQSLLGFCDYAQIGCGNVALRFGAVSPVRPGADSYLEVGFSGGTLEAGASTGEMHLRVHKADYSTFDERDDHSWATNSTFAVNPRITVYVDGALVSGTPP